MGTRGLIGFISKGELSGSYNHMDSYPSYTGVQVLEELDMLNIANSENQTVLEKKLRNLKVVTEEDTPTEYEIQTLKRKISNTLAKYSVYGGGKPSASSEQPGYYELLRQCQGSFIKNLEFGYWLESGSFLKESLFCEWAYFINFDEGTLDIYKGFQTSKPENGYYGPDNFDDEEIENLKDEKYYPCDLVASYPLNALPSIEDFQNHFNY